MCLELAYMIPQRDIMHPLLSILWELYFWRKAEGLLGPCNHTTQVSLSQLT